MKKILFYLTISIFLLFNEIQASEYSIKLNTELCRDFIDNKNEKETIGLVLYTNINTSNKDIINKVLAVHLIFSDIFKTKGWKNCYSIVNILDVEPTEIVLEKRRRIVTKVHNNVCNSDKLWNTMKHRKGVKFNKYVNSVEKKVKQCIIDEYKFTK